MSLLLLLTLSPALTSCSSITVKPGKQSSSNLQRLPDYEESIPYFFFGLIGAKHFDLQDICFGREVEQIRSQYTLTDLGMGVKTLFFYLPKTAEVWCKNE